MLLLPPIPVIVRLKFRRNSPLHRVHRLAPGQTILTPMALLSELSVVLLLRLYVEMLTSAFVAIMDVTVAWTTAPTATTPFLSPEQLRSANGDWSSLCGRCLTFVVFCCLLGLELRSPALVEMARLHEV